MIEKRTITQVLVWKLILNPMTRNTGDSELIAWSDDKDKLMDFYNDHKVEPYKEEGHASFECHGNSHTWRKVFKKGSPLEWYNPFDSEDGSPNYYGQGLTSEWVNEHMLDRINSGIRI